MKSFLNSKGNRENWGKLGISLFSTWHEWNFIELCGMPCGIHMTSKWRLINFVNDKGIFDPTV